MTEDLFLWSHFHHFIQEPLLSDKALLTDGWTRKENEESLMKRSFKRFFESHLSGFQGKIS